MQKSNKRFEVDIETIKSVTPLSTRVVCSPNFVQCFNLTPPKLHNLLCRTTKGSYMLLSRVCTENFTVNV